MVGRCLQALLASTDGAQYINALPIKETLKAMFFTVQFSVQLGPFVYSQVNDGQGSSVCMESKLPPHQQSGMWSVDY